MGMIKAEAGTPGLSIDSIPNEIYPPTVLPFVHYILAGDNRTPRTITAKVSEEASLRA